MSAAGASLDAVLAEPGLAGVELVVDEAEASARDAAPGVIVPAAAAAPYAFGFA